MFSPIIKLQSELSRIGFWLILVLSSILIWNPSVALANDPIVGGYGYRDFSYPSGTGGNSEPSGEKPESKLWWNDGFWWGILWSTAGGAYHIYRLDQPAQDWVDTGTEVDNRQDSRVDALWDGQQLYVVTHIFAKNDGSPAPTGERGELYRYSYNASANTYSLDGGFPVEVTGGRSETLVIAKDSTNQLWVTYVENQQVMVNRSIGGDDRSWGNVNDPNALDAPFVLPVGSSANVSSDDISTIIDFEGRIGVMWSNQSGSNTMYFAVHDDNDFDDTAWSSAVVAYGASGDDHINLKSVEGDSAGKVFAAIKTSQNSALIVLLVCISGDCTSANDWKSHTVSDGGTDSPTRPILLLDPPNRDLYVFTRSRENGDGIYYKTADMDGDPDDNPPWFSAGTIGAPFIKVPNDFGMNDPTATKQNLNGATGMVVLATDGAYFHNFLALNGQNFPIITDFNPTSGPVGTEVTITGSNFTGATAVRFNGTPALVFSEDSDTQIIATVPAGAGTGLISVTTAAGAGFSATAFMVTTAAAPEIDSFTPGSGAVGDAVTITGLNFTGASTVAFNGTADPTFTVNPSGTQISATVPAGASTGLISVTTATGTGFSATVFTVTPAPPPVIDSFAPLNGPVGTEVTITGSNFTEATAVQFNGTPAVVFSVDFDTQIRANVPTGASSGVISVITPADTGVSATPFTVTPTPPPVIDSFTPPSGPVGTEVTIAGSNFTGVTEVAFNGSVALIVTLDSDTQITATVPSGATTGPISVTNAQGTGTSAGTFTVTALPSSITFNPSDDALVRSSRPTNNYGLLTYIRARQSSSVYHSYLKFNVSGVGGSVQSARLRLYLNDGSPDGGSFYLVSNDYLGTSTPWNETGLTWSNAPALSGSPLSAAGSVSGGTWIELDVTAAVSGDGIYSFGFSSSSSNSVYYSSQQGGNPPELVIETDAGSTPTPVIDSFAPGSGAVGDAVTITGLNFTGASTVAFNGTADPTFTVNPSGTQISATVPAGASDGPISVTTPGGTVDSASAFTVTAPLPVVSSFTPASGAVGQEVTITGSNFTGATAVLFNVTPAVVFTVDSGTQIRADVPSGASTGLISVTTAGGTGVSTTAFTVTAPLPVVSSFTPASGPVGQEVTITGSNFTGATAVLFNVTPAVVFTVDSGTQIRADVPSGASTGLISVTTAGGTGVSTTAFTVTAPLPVVSSFTPASGPVGQEVTITGSNFTGATAVLFNVTPAVVFTVDSGTQIRADVPSGAGTGLISVTTAGGTGVSTTAFTVTAPLPVVSSFTPASGPVGQEVTITGSNFTGATAVLFNVTPAVVFTVDSGTQIRADVPSGASTGLISVTTAGGTGVSTTAFTVTAPLPVVSSFTPASGPVGQEVTITGSNFTGATAVLFNVTPAVVFTVDSGTQIRADVPSGASTGLISVTTAGGTGVSTTAFTVTAPLPVVSSFTPASGPVGQEVTITGSNFTGATAVLFNVTPAVVFTVDSGTQIRADVPSGASTGLISVTTAGGTGVSTTAFTVTAPLPVVSSFTPASGPVGQEVTITGSNFTGATAVLFNVTPAVVFTVDSGTQIRADVPSGASTGLISVTTAGGTGVSTTAFTVTAPLPVVSSFTPASGPVGQEVTITGSNFTGATAVLFNVTPAVVFTVDSGTQIRADVPSGASTGLISVTTAGGTGVSTTAFTVTGSPSTLTFNSTDDALVKSTRPTNNYGLLTYIRARQSSSVYHSYLKFNVSGVGGSVQSARLRLYVNDGSPDGGSFYLVSNDYLGTSTPWTETGLTWSNAPALSGSPLSAAGSVSGGTWIELDVTDAITGDGIYSFGFSSSSSNSVYYSSQQGGNPPELVIETSF